MSDGDFPFYDGGPGRALTDLPGPWGLAVIGSRTPREVIEVAVRYLEAVTPGDRMTFELGKREAVLRCAAVGVGPRACANAENMLVGVQRIVRVAFDVELPVLRVALRHDALHDAGWYREMFGVQPEFGAVESLVGYDSAALAWPLPPSSERVRDSCARLCRELLSRHRVRSGIAASVRELLVRDPGRLPCQATVAGSLFVSPRTLSRRLRQEETSYRALLDEVRSVMSEELLGGTGMTTEQIAGRLGYAEAASFIRAFRRWKGCPPQEFRMRAVVDPPAYPVVESA